MRAHQKSTCFADTHQLHVVELPMGARTQLTFTDEPINQARFQPGNPLDTRTQALSPLEVPRGVVSTLRFPDQRSDVLAFALGNVRSPMDVWTVDLKGRKPTASRRRTTATTRR